MANYKKNKRPQEAAKLASVAKKRSQPTGQQAGEENTPRLMAQQRASFALQAVQQAIEHSAIENAEFKSQVRRLPGMLQVNGFGQAMAFYYAKGKSGNLPACGEVYALLESWLCDQNDRSPYYEMDVRAPRLLTAITEADQQAYRQAQAETQALLQWVKRFCEGLIVKERNAAGEES